MFVTVNGVINISLHLAMLVYFFKVVSGIIIITFLLVSCKTAAPIEKNKQHVDECAKDKSAQLNWGLNTVKSGHMEFKGNQLSTGFYFVTDLDSSIFKYTGTELLHNNKKVTWANWCNERWLELSINEINNRNQSDTFTIKGGDSITMFRECWWFQPQATKVDAFKFFTPCNFGIAIHIMDAETDELIFTMDSITFEKQRSVGTPNLFSLNPIVARLKYDVPLFFKDRLVYVSFKLYQADSVKTNFRRKDIQTVDLSSHLKESGWVQWSEEGEKIKTIRDESKRHQCIYCYPTVTSSGITDVFINEDNAYSNCSLRIVNSSGATIQTISLAQWANKINLQLVEKGMYIIVFLDAYGNTLCTTKVIYQ